MVEPTVIFGAFGVVVGSAFYIRVNGWAAFVRLSAWAALWIIFCDDKFDSSGLLVIMVGNLITEVSYLYIKAKLDSAKGDT